MEHSFNARLSVEEVHGSQMPLGGEMHPRDPVFHFERGDLLQAQGKFDDAIAAYGRALAIHPEFAEAHNNLGNALTKIGEPAAAARHYRSALAVAPDFAQAHNNLACALIPLGQLGAAIGHYKQAIALNPAGSSAYTNLALALHYVPGVSSALIAETTRRWAASIRRRPRQETWSNTAVPGRRIRLGYVSGDFRNHPVGYFIEGILAAHDRTAFEVFCYSNTEVPDAMTTRIAGVADHWRSIAALPDDEAARCIATDAIDILVDLSGHTAGHRLSLFAQKPAPVQCTWLGYVGTTGLSEIDYIIADRFVLQPGEEAYYSERPCRLPRSYLCFTPPEATIDIGPLPALDRGGITFGCFNNLLKINGAVIDLWSAVLEAVPGSRLLLKTAQLDNDAICRAIAGEFAVRGIAHDRLALEPGSSREALLATYDRIDIALDPFPFGGGTTTLEALWMGAPVVTLRGDRFVGRVGESILTTIGLPELVADSPKDYLMKAAGLAADLPLLSAMRHGLRGRLVQSPVCDANGFAADLDEVYGAMWREWCGRQRRLAA